MSEETKEQIDKQLDKLDKIIKKLQAPVVEVDEADRREYTLTQVADWLDRILTLEQGLKDIEHVMLGAVERERHKQEFVPLSSGAAMELGYGGGGRSWKHERIKPVLIEAVMESHIDKETGALEAPVSQLMAEVLDIVGPSYWKTTELDKFDIDPDDYSSKRPRKFKAKIHRND